MQKALNPQRDLLLRTPDHRATRNHHRYDYSKTGELLGQRDRHQGQSPIATTTLIKCAIAKHDIRRWAMKTSPMTPRAT